MDQTQQTRLFAINAFLFIAGVLTLLFVSVFTAFESTNALQGLLLIPLLLLIIYLNSKSWFRVSQFMVTYGLMLPVLGLALLDRRTGTEYILIALACCSVVVYERMVAILSSFGFAFLCYIFYVWYDASFPFVPDPTTPYLVIQNSLMFLSGFAVLAQSLVFRWLIRNYAGQLKDANTEIHSINEELKASNEELKTFSENLDSIVKKKSAQLQAYNYAINTNTYSVTLDHSGLFISVNEPLVLASGYAREELIGNHYKIFNTGQFTKQQLENRYKWLAAGNTWTGELRYITKHGSIFWIDCVIIPIREDDGSIKEFLSVGIPITERKNLEEKNRSAIAALEDVAFRTSHNIRGPWLVLLA